MTKLGHFQITVIALLLSIGPANAEQPIVSNYASNFKTIEAAIAKMENYQKEQWRFYLQTSGDQNQLEQFDPLSITPWKLISIDGKEPTKKQAINYHESKQEQKLDESEDEELELNNIDLESLKLIEKVGNIEVLSFKFKEQQDDLSKHLQGRLWHDKKGNWIQKIELTNPTEFSPAFSVKIKELSITMTFIEIADSIFAPKEIISKVTGKAMGFKKIKQNIRQRAYNYKRVN